MFSFFKSPGKNKQAFTIAFYNLENLFDTKKDPKILDTDFTPNGKKHWNYNRYKRKINKLSDVISQIGTKRSYFSPAIVGVAEVENETVLSDLIGTINLKNENWINL